jgi:hypothetical protein
MSKGGRASLSALRCDNNPNSQTSTYEASSSGYFEPHKRIRT